MSGLLVLRDEWRLSSYLLTFSYQEDASAWQQSADNFMPPLRIRRLSIGLLVFHEPSDQVEISCPAAGFVSRTSP
jgi:hypothetical protein